MSHTFNPYGYAYVAPTETIEAINRYVEHGIEPGSFTRAVLENNLRDAVARADPSNMGALPALAEYLYNHVPGACWGSPARVDEWLAHHAALRAART